VDSIDLIEAVFGDIRKTLPKTFSKSLLLKAQQHWKHHFHAAELYKGEFYVRRNNVLQHILRGGFSHHTGLVKDKQVLAFQTGK
jgi:hypothetical protein